MAGDRSGAEQVSDLSSPAIPELPLQALRDAIGQADLDAAFALVEAHDRAVRAALPARDDLPDPRQVQAWMNLAAGQEALLRELGALRDQAATNLRQLQRHRSGANAYARAMG